jgi:hypothetical protein
MHAWLAQSASSMHLSPKAHPKFPSSEQVPPQSTSVSPALMIPSEQCAGVGLCVG